MSAHSVLEYLPDSQRVQAVAPVFVTYSPTAGGGSVVNRRGLSGRNLMSHPLGLDWRSELVLDEDEWRVNKEGTHHTLQGGRAVSEAGRVASLSRSF